MEEKTAFVHLCPSKESWPKGRGRSKEEAKRTSSPGFCRHLRTGSVNCCQIKKTERETAVDAFYKKQRGEHFPPRPSQESPHRQNYTVTVPPFAFQRFPRWSECGSSPRDHGNDRKGGKFSPLNSKRLY